VVVHLFRLATFVVSFRYPVFFSFVSLWLRMEMTTRKLDRLLIQLDTAFAKQILKNEIVIPLRKLAEKNRANGLGDTFWSICQRVIHDDQRFEYRIALILFWANVNREFAESLTCDQTRVHAEQIIAKIRELCTHLLNGVQLDGKPFPSKVSAAEMKPHMRTVGQFVHTFMDMYLACF
jgi:hypothetical protein